MSQLEVDKVIPQSGTTLTLGESGDTITIASGATFTPTLIAPIIDEINDNNGNEEIIFTTTTSAVNELTIANAATGNAPEISATGDDIDIDLKLTPKGAGNLVLDGIEFPNADGSAGEFLQTDGSGVLSFSSAGSFVFLGETTASNVATVDLNGYFTSDYDIYKIFIDGLYGSVNDVRTHMQFSTGSYTVQTSNYYSANVAGFQNNGSQGSYGEGVFNDSYAIICEYISSNSTQQSNIELTLYNPLTTSYVKSYSNAFSGRIGNITATRSGCGGGSWNDTTAITGVRFLMASGNISARKIKIYGIKNS
jgi:hypothetical protein